MRQLLIGLSMIWCALSATAWGQVVLDDAAFSWQPEVSPQFTLERIKLRDQGSGVIDGRKELQLYHQLAQDPKANVDLTQWRAKQGPDPKEIRLRLSVRNLGTQVSRPTPVRVVIWGKLGSYSIGNKSLLADSQAIRRSARWQQITVMKDTLPVLAPDESLTWWTPPFHLGEYLYLHRNLFPTALKAIIQTGRSSKTVVIPVHVDAFAIEQLMTQ